MAPGSPAYGPTLLDAQAARRPGRQAAVVLGLLSASRVVITAQRRRALALTVLGVACRRGQMTFAAIHIGIDVFLAGT